MCVHTIIKTLCPIKSEITAARVIKQLVGTHTRAGMFWHHAIKVGRLCFRVLTVNPSAITVWTGRPHDGGLFVARKFSIRREVKLVA